MVVVVHNNRIANSQTRLIMLYEDLKTASWLKFSRASRLLVKICEKSYGNTPAHFWGDLNEGQENQSRPCNPQAADQGPLLFY